MPQISDGKSPEEWKALKEIRHRLHELAERSWKEVNTSEYVKSLIEDCSPDALHTGIGEQGMVAVFKGQSDGPSLLFRAELDALPIEADADLNYTSDDSDTSHRCGHDGHMTTVIGIARYLSENRPASGEVWLLFQPAEETGEGAARMLEHDFFDKHTPDLAFAYHNLPGYPMHQIIVNEGIFTATVRSVVLEFEGATSHAGQPEQGKNPAYIIAQLINACRKWNQRNNGAYSNVVPIHVSVGAPAYGTSPGSGELHLTLRSTDPEQAKNLKKEIIDKAQHLTDEEDVELETRWLQPFESCVNSARAVDMIQSAARTLSLDTSERDEPFRWGEDFGQFIKAFEGALFCIGAGTDHPALHSNEYDFPDELLKTGVNMFRTIIEQKLNDS